MPSSTKIPLTILFLLSLSACLGQIAQNPETLSRDSIKVVRDRLSEVRGLAFTAEVPIVFERSLNDRLEAVFQADLGAGDRKREDISLAYVKLGLLPFGVDLSSTLLSFYSSQALAFYDSRAKEIVIAANPDGPSGTPVFEEAREKVIVHELTHALQDRAFSLGTMLRPSGNGDATIALRAVAEGDAVLTEYAYSFGGLNEWLPDHLSQMLDSAIDDPILPNIPRFVADKARFQYWAGARFVLRFLGQNGWLPVNLLYKYPPLSTEQVLHPEKYLDLPDPPIRIKLNNLSGLFSSQWREIENDTLGELSVQCLFNQFLGPADAALVASGWGGDRFVAYRNGDEVAFIWATVWDSAKDAEEFYENYQKILWTKYGTPSVDTRFYIEKRDRSVMVIEGFEQDRIKRNIETVWNAMVFEKEDFQPPPFSSSIGSR